MQRTIEDQVSSDIKTLLQRILKLRKSAYLKIIEDPVAQTYLSPEDRAYLNNLQPVDESAAEESISSFVLYLKTLRKTPSLMLFQVYLQDVCSLLSENKSRVLVTAPERKHVNARKAWSDVVSHTHADNQHNVKTNQVKKTILVRLAKLGYKQEDLERIYLGCIDYIKQNSVIVVTFNAAKAGDFLQIKDYQLLNLFERGQNNFAPQDAQEYKEKRETTERAIFPAAIAKSTDLFGNIHARPRYAALVLLSSTKIIQPTTNYGQSFVVLSDLAKHASLFNYRDSLIAHYNYHQKVQSCSIHFVELLLQQSSEKRLQAIAQYVLTGILPGFYNNHNHSLDVEEYIEVMLPAIDLLDPSMVQHIHVSKVERTLSAAELQFFAERGITCTNAATTPYGALCSEFITHIERKNIEAVKAALRQHPVLAKITSISGLEPIHIAARSGCIEIVKCLIAAGCAVNLMSPEGKLALHYAIESTNLEVVMAVAEAQCRELYCIARTLATSAGKSAGQLALEAGVPAIQEYLVVQEKNCSDNLYYMRLIQFLVQRFFIDTLKEYKSSDKNRIQSILEIEKLFKMMASDAKLSLNEKIIRTLGCLRFHSEQAQAKHTGQKFKWKTRSKLADLLDKVCARIEDYCQDHALNQGLVDNAQSIEAYRAYLANLNNDALTFHFL